MVEYNVQCPALKPKMRKRKVSLIIRRSDLNYVPVSKISDDAGTRVYEVQTIRMHYFEVPILFFQESF